MKASNTTEMQPRQTDPAYVATEHGIEVRCAAHGHLLGIFVSPKVLEIKCRDEYVRVTFGKPRPRLE